MENNQTKGFLRFLLHCSGANIELVEQCPKSEHIKYIGIGTTILITAVLAFFSGAYALFTIFENKIVAIIFGVIWAFMIFNLDRLIVSSMRKTSGWWKQTFIALPRIVLAIFIGFVISKPLEIRLLQTKIDKEILLDTNEKEEELDQKCIDIRAESERRVEVLKKEITDKESNRPPLLLELESNLENLNIERKREEKQINKKNAPLSKSRRRLKKEIKELEIQERNTDRSFLLKIKGKEKEITKFSRKIRKNRAPLKELDAQIEQTDNQIGEEFSVYRSEITELKEKNKQKVDTIESQSQADILMCKEDTEKDKTKINTNSLIDYIIALEKATDDEKIISWVSLFLITLFVLIETVPVLVKLISPKGPYDSLLQLVENSYDFKVQMELNKRNAVLEKEIKILTEISDAEINQELVNNKKILQSISEAHTEIINEQIGLWLKDEKEKLNNISNSVEKKHEEL